MLPDATAQGLIYGTLGAFLLLGLWAGRPARYHRRQSIPSSPSNSPPLSSSSSSSSVSSVTKPITDGSAAEAGYFGGTRVSGPSSLLLGVNFYASGLGAWILFSLPEVGALAGPMGVVAYVLACTLPLALFAYIGPKVRESAPDGFTLTAQVRARYGRIVQTGFSILTCVYMVVYMTSELTSVSGVITSLTGLDPLVPVIILAIVTTLYTAYGGFRASIVTDGVQGYLIALLILLVLISTATSITIPSGTIPNYPTTHPTKSSLQLLVILPIATTLADLFHQGFWQRVYAAPTDKHLRRATLFAATLTIPTLFLLGLGGMLAAWSGVWDRNGPDPGYSSLFLLLTRLPQWAVAFSLILGVALVCSSVDTLQSALVSTLAQDVLGSRSLSLLSARVIGLLTNIPAIVLSVRGYDVMQIFLVGDLVAAVAAPPLLLGMVHLGHRVRAPHIFLGMLLSIFSVPLIGIYRYGSFTEGWALWGLPDGLYADGWTVFVLFLVVPSVSALGTYIPALFF